MPIKIIILAVAGVLIAVVCLGFLMLSKNNHRFPKLKIASLAPAKPAFGIHYIEGTQKKGKILSQNDIRTINKTLAKYSKHIANFDLYLNDNLKQEQVAKKFDVVSFEGVIATVAGPKLTISANRCAQKFLGKTVSCKIKDSLKHYYKLSKNPEYEGRIATIFN